MLSIRLKEKLSAVEDFKGIGVADLFKYNTIEKLVQSRQIRSGTSYKLRRNGEVREKTEIGIIGMSGSFSGAKNVSELWDLIDNQKEGIRILSESECRQLEIAEELLRNPDFVPVSGKVEGIELFDPLFWEISPNEAKQLNPQIRKFIEHCWYVLESSGYVHERRKHNIGVFAGSGENNYLNEHVLNVVRAVESGV